MSWNGAERGTTEAQLIQSTEHAIRSVLPAEWSITVARQPVIHELPDVHQPDAQLTIAAPDGTRALVLIECKSVVVPRDVASMAYRLKTYMDAAAHHGAEVSGALLAASFVSPTTRARLDQHGLGWFDITGNLRLRLDSPVVFIDRAGADRSSFRDPADRQLKSLRGSAAAKVVLELCETSFPIGVRELAERAQVGAATSARVLELLDREAVVVRNKDGAVTSVRKRALVDRWVQDYKVMASNEVIATLDPRGVSHALNALSSLDIRIAVTGSAAARAYLPSGMTSVSPLVSLSLYAEDPIGVMAQLGLRTVKRGTNVLVLRPYDDVVYAKSHLVDGVDFVAPAQVVADLLTGPGRSSEEAEQLMAALESSEPGWES